MRVARSGGLSARVLVVAAFAPVFLSVPPVHADAMCTTMIPDMQAGYRALERSQYTEADKSFTVAANKYANCRFPVPENSPDDFRWSAYWGSYALAGSAAANFGSGKITEGLDLAKKAESGFGAVSSGTGSGEGASESLRRSAREGLGYVRSLESAKQPLLPKIWLDWKAAHPTGSSAGAGSAPPAGASSDTVATILGSWNVTQTLSGVEWGDRRGITWSQNVQFVRSEAFAIGMFPTDRTQIKTDGRVAWLNCPGCVCAIDRERGPLQLVWRADQKGFSYTYTVHPNGECDGPAHRTTADFSR